MTTSVSPATTVNPGKGLGIVGLILSFLPFLGLIGLIVSIVAKVKSKKAGFKNGPATAGIVIGILVLIGTIIIAIVAGVSAAAVLQACAELGEGVHELETGVTVTCGA